MPASKDAFGDRYKIRSILRSMDEMGQSLRSTITSEADQAALFERHMTDTTFAPEVLVETAGIRKELFLRTLASQGVVLDFNHVQELLQLMWIEGFVVGAKAYKRKIEG